MTRATCDHGKYAAHCGACATLRLAAAYEPPQDQAGNAPVLLPGTSNASPLGATAATRGEPSTSLPPGDACRHGAVGKPCGLCERDERIAELERTCGHEDICLSIAKALNVPRATWSLADLIGEVAAMRRARNATIAELSAKLSDVERERDRIRKHYDAAGPEHNLLALLDLYNERTTEAIAERDRWAARIAELEAKLTAAQLERDKLLRHYDAAAPERNLLALLDMYADREAAALRRVSVLESAVESAFAALRSAKCDG
jgi:hypothetical protein